MSLSRVAESYISLRTRIRRAFVRPDPYGLPEWVLSSQQLANHLKQQHGAHIISMIDLAYAKKAETGAFVCYDADKEDLHFGPTYVGASMAVTIQDCTGFRPIGSFHTHLGPRRQLAFSPPDIQNGLHEFVLAVGGVHLFDGAAYQMAVLSPYEYWKLPYSERGKIEKHMRDAIKIIMEMNRLYVKKPPEWGVTWNKLNDESNALMEKVFKAMNMVYVKL